MFEIQDFSFRTRENNIQKLKEEEFDFLIIGGGINGVAVARDAASRGLKVALIEKNDFAYGTSSRSSKLIHGGFRYLENFELGLVYEALHERALFLKTAPHLVHPMPFYFPVFDDSKNKKIIIGLGLWVYDLLTFFRSPKNHRNLSKKKILKDLPGLRSEGLKGGYVYYDADMWDDLMVIEIGRDAQERGAVLVNYIEAQKPLWTGENITGFLAKDSETGSEFSVRAKKVVVCTGPWTDVLGQKLSTNWKRWLKPSKGLHLVFDLKKFPLPGTVVMSNKSDNRIAFVMPRPDYGAGVAIVGTTDSPTSYDPEKLSIEPEDVTYLFDLLKKHFPQVQVTVDDVISAYVGIKPLMDPDYGKDSAQGTSATPEDLQKVSREHYIGEGPGGVILAAGGKYTTHRPMAAEIVDKTLELWKKEHAQKKLGPVPAKIGPSKTLEPFNKLATKEAIAKAEKEAQQRGWTIPSFLLKHYGLGALWIMEDHLNHVLGQSPPAPLIKGGAEGGGLSPDDPQGFPLLESELRYHIKTGMVVHLEDFYLRRVALFMSRKDHGFPWAEKLSHVMAKELGWNDETRRFEIDRLYKEIASREAWKEKLASFASKND